MITDSVIANWTLMYSTELLAFSIVLILLLNSQLKKIITAWILSNVIMIFIAQFGSRFDFAVSSSAISTVIITGNALAIVIHYYAVNFTRKFSFIPIAIFTTAILIWVFAKFSEFKWLGGLAITTGGFAANLICAWTSFKNPLWKGLRYRNVLIAGFIACSGMFFLRSMLFISNRNNGAFPSELVTTQYGTLLVLISSIVLQIGFIGLVVNYDFRNRRREDRETAEATERSRGMAEEQRLMETVAEERLDMISLLTHEVRQPINNAQAALQALAQETNGSTPADAEIRDALARAQSVLDGITLSISNAILGVSLIDNNQAITTFASDLVELVELALSDCPAEQRHRIHIHSAANAVFSDLDPVLIRLAMRNLFDNALKYSPPTSSVHVEIAQDDQRLGASIKVSNQITDANGLNDDIFGRRVRGEKVAVEGSGYGLFLVDKVAAAHSGTISYTIKDGQHVTFDLFVPD
jgi:signal transduction histidine kinase